MQRKLLGALMMALIIILVAAPQTVDAGPEAQNPNLLTNPGFEPPYYEDFRSDGGGFVANGWRAWWYNDAEHEFDAPEFKEARLDVDPFRVRNGLAAQQYFRPWAKHLGGISQLVNVTPGSRLRFSIYGHAWSSFCELDEKKDEIDCDSRNSFYGGENRMNMKIGIAPVGTTDQNDPSIVWSEVRGVYDNFELFTVEATAVGDTVTVFTYSTPDWPSAVINVYWDDAELIVVGDAPPPADDSGGDDGGNNDDPPPPADNGGSDPPPADNGGSGTGSIDPQPVNAEGAQVHVVQSGETLGGIAFAYGIPTQRLRELNSLTTDTVFPGQELIVSEAPPPTPEPTEEPSPEPTEAAEPDPTEEPTEVAEVESAPVGRICAVLFEDHNADGIRDVGESLLPGGLLSVAGASAASHPTDGISEPFCFADLSEGSYVTAADAPNGYSVTGQAEVNVQVVSGEDVEVSFGAAPDTALEPVELQPDVEVAPDEAEGGGLLDGPLLLILGIVGAVLLLGGAGVAVYALVIAPRRSSIT